MNKTPWAYSDAQAWIDGMQAFGAESGGLARGYLIDRRRFARLYRAADAGDVESIALCISVTRALQSVRLNKPRKQCVFCNDRIRRPGPAAFAVFLPRSGVGYQPEVAVTAAVCKLCLAARPDANKAVCEAMQVMWPTARIIAVEDD